MSLRALSDEELLDEIRSMREALRMYQREIERREHEAPGLTDGSER